MKQNGVRLVQRKFAQGVPIPASGSSLAPPPPERKAEPPYPPKNVYHNNMSARSLLDIVSMQNIHKHKQEPLVVLERLRADEIPPPLPKVRRVRKRPAKAKKNNMCLRSGKRKSTDAVKAVARKRKKLSSESTDDVPLMYYFNRPCQAKPADKPKDTDKDKKTRAATTKKSDDRNFTFKEPTNPARLSYRLFKKKAAAKAGRTLPVRTLKKSGVPVNGRWSSLRSARGSEPRLARPVRSSVLLSKKPLKPAARKRSRSGTVSKDENPPLPPPPSASDLASSSKTSVRDSVDSFSTLIATVEFNMSSSSSTVDVVNPRSSPTLSFDLDRESTSGQQDWCIPENLADFKSEPFATDVMTVVRMPHGTPSIAGEEEQCNEIISENAEKCNSIVSVVGDNRNVKVKDGQNVYNEKRQTDNLYAEKRRTDNFIAEKRLSNNLNAEKRQTDNFIAEKGQSNNLNAEKRQTDNIVAEKRQSNNFNAEKRQTDNCVAENRQSNNLNAEKRQTDNFGAENRQSNNLNAENRQTDNFVAENRQSNNLNAEKRQTDNLDAGKRQEPLAAESNKESEGNENVASMEIDVESRETRRVQESQKRDERKKGVNPKTITKKTAEKNMTMEKSIRKRPVTKPTLKEAKKTTPKRGAKIVPEEAPTSTRLLRNSREPQPAPNPDVYEFDAELEASRPPSSLRRRNQPAEAAQPTPEPSQPPVQPSVQPAPTPTSPDSVEYLDILPRSTHCIQITPKKQPETGAECPSVRLVPKEEISTNKKKNLIENLSNSPALLNKFFNCLTAELQNKLDNLIAAEGLNEAATSKEETYLDQKTGSVFEAPTFYPTAEEFEDPIKYYDKIAPQASIYGLCKIVPPDGFKPPCNISDIIRFAVIYQYISKMYNRWGPVSRELAAIKAHLRTQSVVFARSPLLDGSEVNLPKLYYAVERNGGLNNVMQRKRWGRVADEMKLTKLQHPERKLDPIYMRYLLPYATLSNQERQNIMAEVEKCWTTKYQKMLQRARNPFQRQNRMLGTECESESDEESDDGNTAGALHEAEDCIVQGRTMNLATFKKIATSLMDAHFEPSKQPPTALDVEKAYWRAVLLGTEHIVANTASIDTGEEGYGFPKDPEAEYGTHPWNLKVLARNPNNVLRYLGPVLGVTVPTLHLSMLFSTSCWHRDPHGLPWTEYMHSGADKIWYGIPRNESANFRRAVETLCPAYCQNKSIWLASEITMVPPNILSEHGVKLSRLLQKPGEYVLVFPEAHSCSITTGFGISESVYFASNGWLSNVYKLFQDLRNSCEPSMFSLEQLMLNGSADPSAPPQVCAVLCTLLAAELEHRRALEDKGLKVQELPASSAPLNTSYFRAWNTRDQDECEYCRSTLFLSKVTGLTGRKSAVCPEHALRLLEAKKYKNVELSTLEFVSSYSTSALEEMLERLESRTSEEISRAPSVIDLTGPEREATPAQN